MKEFLRSSNNNTYICTRITKYNYSGYGHRYYCSFGENDSYEMYIIEDPEDGINCFGWGCGYVRVE